MCPSFDIVALCKHAVYKDRGRAEQEEQIEVKTPSNVQLKQH